MDSGSGTRTIPSPLRSQTLSATVGQLVAARRRELGLTLQQVATRVGCAKSYLSMIEQGRRPSPPGAELLARLESALELPAASLLRAAQWQATPATVRREVSQLQSANWAAQRLAELLGQGPEAGGGDGGGNGGGRTALDRAHRSGELKRLIDRIAPPPPAAEQGGALPVRLPVEIPLINKVAAGYPREFTDLGYPARAADEYIRSPDIADPDAFACRVVGDSMMPDYREGDIVIFSPSRPVKSGMDCFARIEPDHETTFKRIYFERADAAGEAGMDDGGGEQGGELIRLQPLNPAYPARTFPREQIAGLYAAVSITRPIPAG